MGASAGPKSGGHVVYVWTLHVYLFPGVSLFVCVCTSVFSYFSWVCLVVWESVCSRPGQDWLLLWLGEIMCPRMHHVCVQICDFIWVFGACESGSLRLFFWTQDLTLLRTYQPVLGHTQGVCW